MINDIPINKSPILTEWYDTGFRQGSYHAWLHGKNCPDSTCRCIALHTAVIDQLRIEEDWKVFITRVGWLAGFGYEREGDISAFDGEDQADGTEASGQPA
jgi:hypothetical protein